MFMPYLPHDVLPLSSWFMSCACAARARLQVATNSEAALVCGVAYLCHRLMREALCDSWRRFINDKTQFQRDWDECKCRGLDASVI